MVDYNIPSSTLQLSSCYLEIKKTFRNVVRTEQEGEEQDSSQGT